MVAAVNIGSLEIVIRWVEHSGRDDVMEHILISCRSTEMFSGHAERQGTCVFRLPLERSHSGVAETGTSFSVHSTKSPKQRMGTSQHKGLPERPMGASYFKLLRRFHR